MQSLQCVSTTKPGCSKLFFMPFGLTCQNTALNLFKLDKWNIYMCNIKHIHYILAIFVQIAYSFRHVLILTDVYSIEDCVTLIDLSLTVLELSVFEQLNE